jgi:hypothetical protein
VKEQIIQNTKYQSIIIIFAGLLAGGYIFNWLSIEILRYTSIGILVTQIWFESKIKQTLFLTSPLFLLSCLCLFFFSFLQGLTVYLSKIPDTAYIIAVGSDAERFIGAFALISFAAHACVQLFTSSASVTERVLKLKINSFILTVFMGAIVILSIINFIYFFYPLGKTTTFFSSMRHLSLPLQTFMLAFLMRQTIANELRFKVLFSVILCCSISGMLAVGEGKIPIFIGLALLAYWLRLKNISIKKAAFAVIIFTFFGTSLLNVMMLNRSVHVHPTPMNLKDNFELNANLTGIPAKDGVPNIFKVPITKLIWRQTDTMYCFKNVIEAHLNEPFTFSKQFFWVKGIVPRSLWPEKPNLSLGSTYKSKYCRLSVNDLMPYYDERHSSSITLLGQPIIQGGVKSLILHVGIFFVILSGITFLSRDAFSLTTMSIAALLPWLIDFDQDFTMYIANAAKFFLAMSPLIFYAFLSEKNYNFVQIPRLLLRQFKKRR